MWSYVWVWVSDQCPRSSSVCFCGWAPTATLHTPHPPVCWSPALLFAPVSPWWKITVSEKRTEWTTSSNISTNSRMEHTNFFRYTEFVSKIIIIFLHKYFIITKMVQQCGSLSYYFLSVCRSVWLIYLNMAHWRRLLRWSVSSENHGLLFIWVNFTYILW